MASTVGISAGQVELAADLTIPQAAAGMVAFAHGSGSGRHSPRNRLVAERLQQAGLGTLLLDLLTEDEEQQDLRTRALRFDIPMLARRLIAAVDWLLHGDDTAALSIGCFGASTGAAAALIAAAERPRAVRAVVSRGGRPDLAAEALERVEAPTLLIVGGADPTAIDLNQEAQKRLRSEAHLKVVEDATHLFEEPGALDRVADLASAWFVQHLAGRG